MLGLERMKIDESFQKSDYSFLNTNRLCYTGCSKINPHLAGLCDIIDRYFNSCPTNGRLNRDSKEVDFQGGKI